MALPQVKRGLSSVSLDFLMRCYKVHCESFSQIRTESCQSCSPPSARITHFFVASFLCAHTFSSVCPLPIALLSLWLSFCPHCCIAAVRSHNVHSAPKGPRASGFSLVNMNSTISLSLYLHSAHKVPLLQDIKKFSDFFTCSKAVRSMRAFYKVSCYFNNFNN